MCTILLPICSAWSCTVNFFKDSSFSIHLIIVIFYLRVRVLLQKDKERSSCRLSSEAGAPPLGNVHALQKVLLFPITIMWLWQKNWQKILLFTNAGMFRLSSVLAVYCSNFSTVKVCYQEEKYVPIIFALSVQRSEVVPNVQASANIINSTMLFSFNT